MPRGRPPKYPWPAWTDGKRHFIKAISADEWSPAFAADQAKDGIDVYPDNVKVASMRAECHAAARRKGGKADTKIIGNTTVQFRYIES